ncbi:hypothetical protein FEM48_Zijuj10G0031000 [Ziziphus jujuba var. spinosa]|uniref:SBP-type domain-containing protein n=1 Tax=Ziziphus jujuba var. spinosa TaxID=714518 RepID=A0A978UKX9_ZIZJJ|nr:squamosa promoter-binding-like protein 12 [Ziziphus jujuba var. spinosa]KAH7515481.1 hypothetical protein FEM48_Zijuj10G0031000 [Ziziphus jujuba var. spinosa]
MEWNTKPSLLWELENLLEFDVKATENPKKLQLTDCCVEGDRGISSGSFNSPGDGGGSGGTGGYGSDLGHTSSKSSKSASISSPSFGESKTSKFSIEAFEGHPKDFSGNKESAEVEPSGSSPTPEISAGSVEPLLSLKLGKRMYFEDASAGNNTKTSSLAVDPTSSPTTTKRCKSSCQNALVPRCQVEGCNLDLSSAKDYHRKHRICESHSKSPKVIVGGLERRFCQQCSRFHPLSEFDEKKRSCRRRLSDHNARRRKPQPEAVRLNPTRLSSLYDGQQQMNIVFDQSSRLYTRNAVNLTWDGTDSSKLGETKEFLSKPAKAGGATGQLHLLNNDMPSAVTTLYHDSGGLSPSKGTASEVLNQGLEESVISSNLDTTQDLHRALSLLSTSSWGSCGTKSVSQGNPNHINHTTMPQPSNTMHAISQGLPFGSEYWQSEQLSLDNPSHISHPRSNSSSSNHFQDLNLFRGPYESGFYPNQFN